MTTDRAGAGGLADPTTPKAGSNQVDNLLEASIPYKLERDGIYLVEVKDRGMTMEDASLITRYYRECHGVDIQFIFTHGNDFALQAVPAVRADDAVNDLASTDGADSTDVNNPPKGGHNAE